MTYRTTWTAGQNAVARFLWLDGVDARTIGERVGKSRAAVIGRADRKGWGPHPHAKKPGAKWRRVAATPTLSIITGGRNG